MENNKSLNILKEVVIVLVLFSIILIPFLTDSGLHRYFLKLTGSNCTFLDLKEFHGDENHWLINSNRYFKLFFIDKALNSKQWKEFSAYDQPPVGKYIIGLILFIAGDKDEIKQLEHTSLWDFSKSLDWNITNGNIPPERLLSIVRLTMALFGAFTCLLIYYVGRQVFSLKTGIIASLLLAYNPLMVTYSRRAMVDAPLLFFLTANVILIIFFYRAFLQQKSFNAFVFAALIGINAALAVGVKLYGGLAIVIFVIFCLLLIIITSISRQSFANRLKMIKTIVCSLIISIFITGVVFIGMNPYLYSNPLKRMTKMIKHRTLVVQRQQKDNPKAALTSLVKKSNSIVKRTLFPGNYVILGSILKIPIDFCLFILGLIMLLYLENKHLIQNRMPSLKTIVILWFIAIFVGTLAWIPLDWDRYYLPVIPCIVMMVGYGIDKIIDNGWILLTKKYRE